MSAKRTAEGGISCKNLTGVNRSKLNKKLIQSKIDKNDLKILLFVTLKRSILAKKRLYLSTRLIHKKEFYLTNLDILSFQIIEL